MYKYIIINLKKCMCLKAINNGIIYSIVCDALFLVL